ncbi:MAG: hypothetical protein ACE5LU_24320 [Anaerolineae bacterium]
MAAQTEGDQPMSIDEETLKAVQDTVYERLREPLLAEIRERLIAEAAEQPMPLYYDRYITSQTQRLEEGIERNGQRIMELQREMDRRFTEAREDRQALRDEIDRRFTEAKEDRQALRGEINRRFTELRGEINRHFETVDRRFETIDRRFEGLGTKIDEQNVRMRNWVLAAIVVII